MYTLLFLLFFPDTLHDSLPFCCVIFTPQTSWVCSSPNPNLNPNHTLLGVTASNHPKLG